MVQLDNHPLPSNLHVLPITCSSYLSYDSKIPFIQSKQENRQNANTPGTECVGGGVFNRFGRISTQSAEDMTVMFIGRASKSARVEDWDWYRRAGEIKRALSRTGRWIAAGMV